MFFDITDAAEFPYKMQPFAIPSTAAADEVDNLSLSKMAHATPVLTQASAQIDVFKIHEECFVQSPQLLQQRSSDH